MDYDAILEQVVALLHQQQRLSYRVLKLRLQLDDDMLEALKEDLIYAKQLAVDEDGRVLVWTGAAGAATAPGSGATEPVEPPDTTVGQDLQVGSPSPAPRTPEAERRQLTVLFCDLVNSTVLASQLDPEEWREVVRAYQATCATVIARYEGYIAQYLGDGLLVYFGYPQAHEDDAQRAVRAGLGMVEAMGQLNPRLGHERGVHMAVRLGIHTGLVVVGEMGGGGRHEQLALGDTPNVAARLQGIAAPDTVVISATTYRLVQGWFECRDLGPQTVKGMSAPVPVYGVLGESGARSRLEVAGSTGLTPLVGREQEVALLRERWAQVKDGLGQVVLLSGEAGIGKSRLVQVVKAHVAGEAHVLWECRGSAYHQNSSLYPVIDLMQRVLQFQPDDSLEEKLRKLERALTRHATFVSETVPLLASLLSLSLPERYPPLTFTPQRQRQKTLEAVLEVLLVVAAQQPVLFIVEDLHWIDPSTLELLSLLIDQGPTARILTLLTCRSEFRPPWDPRPHLTQLTLSRLPRPQAEVMVAWLAGGKALPAEVRQQVVAKTDGVPLFVEELTKMVLEAGLVQAEEDRYGLIGPLAPLAIPATLQDSLRARLDRLRTAKGIAQLGASLGRHFSFELLQAVADLDDVTLQRELSRLVDAEFLYQRGHPPQATYTFKHALMQEAAYQSLLKRTRQQYHQRIAQVIETRFPETRETQPELLAHHYLEAGCSAQALPYWQRAGERAIERSAYLEARAHLTKGLEALKALPDTPERTRQELELQTTVGSVLITIQGGASPDVERAYARARELCRRVRETPQLFPTLRGLHRYHLARGQMEAARELGAQLLSLAQRVHDPVLLVQAHLELGSTLFSLGELVSARAHVEQGIALDHPQQSRSRALPSMGDPGVVCRGFAAWTLWVLGYPDQAFKRSHEALILAQQLAHPVSYVAALYFAAVLHYLRREEEAAQERAETVAALAREQGFAQPLSAGTILRGWALAMQGEGEEGLAQMRQGLAARQGTGSERTWLFYLAMLAEAYLRLGQAEAGLKVLAEAPAEAHTTVARYYDAELDRLKGELLLLHSPTHPEEAEARFRQALATALHQQAKSLELRAALSLSRLWQQQGKHDEARGLLAPVYGWFTEGFDTADLQEAKALLQELA